MLRSLSFFLIGLCLSTAQCFAYSGGTGEPNDPYQIATPQDLIDLGNEPNDYDKDFILTADIDLSGYTFDQAVIAPDEDGDSSFDGTEFLGSFDGQGHVVSHLSIQGAYYLGLFGKCSSGAIISNLGLEAVDVNSIGDSIGGLVGRNYGRITSSYSTGSVSGTGVYVGGLVGVNSSGSITSSYSTGLVSGTGDYVGGLVGHNSGLITSSYSTGSVSGDDDVGGLVGYNGGSTTSSYSTGSVSGNDRVGGLVGINGGSTTSSYSTGSVSGTGVFVGGLVGWNYYGSITSSYSTGSVSGNDRVGGLVGYNGGSITSSYSTGSVSGILDGVGGLVGVNGGSITSSFWDNQTSGQSESAGGTGLTTAQMHSIQTYINASWDLVGETPHGTCNYWVIQEGHYPSLAVFSELLPVELNGAGSLDDPYLLTDVNELGSVWSRPGACYRLEADIDLNDIVWNSAVVPGFGGVFDGNEHVISSLRINGGGCLGLFGICTSNATIFNLGLESVDVSGTGYFVGGLVGVNGGSITSSYSTGLVTGDYDVGGLVGDNSGSITSSYSTGLVTGDYDVGGLVGDNSGSITSSYSTGSVSGDDDVGGLVGDNSGSITSSYSTGSVSGDDDVGGLVGVNGGRFVGDNDGIIMSSYSTGSVTGDYDVGGLVGNNYNGTITSSYSTGSVTGISNYLYNIGGLVGWNEGSITSSYSTGSVTGIGEGAGGGLVGRNYYGSITSSYSTGSVSGDYFYGCVGGLVGCNEEGLIASSYSTGSVSGNVHVGGLVGFNYGIIILSFWDTQTSGQANSAGGTGLITSEMQYIDTFLDEGWDFVDETANGTEDIWWMPVSDYPRLWWEE